MQQSKRTIIFDPGPHTYRDEFKNFYTSATTVIGQLEPEFDSEFWTMYKAIEKELVKRDGPFTGRLRPDTNKRTITIDGKTYDLSYLYSTPIIEGVDPRAVKLKWERLTEIACAEGTEKHDYLEDCILKANGETRTSKSNVSPIYTISKEHVTKIASVTQLAASGLKHLHPAIYKMLKEIIEAGWTLYAEKRLYSSVHLIAGTADVLAVKGRKFMIIDWKTNKHKLEFRSGYYRKEWGVENGEWKKIKTEEFVDKAEYYLRPLHRLPLSKGMTYVLQLSLYAYMCELWDMKYERMILCHLRNKGGGEFDYPVFYDSKTDPRFFYRKDEMKILFDWRLRQINKTR